MNSSVVPPADSCGNLLFVENFVCPPNQSMCCSARFEANPDASGPGIIIAFVINGANNIFIQTLLWYLKTFKRFPGSSRDFEKWLQNLADFLAQASLFPGITLLVAAFSQHKRITVYHLYISIMLADLTTSGRLILLINVLLSDSRITKIQASLATIFQFLLLASFGILIYRLSVEWSDAPGKCFVMFNSGLDTLHDRDRLRIWIVVQIATWFYWHFIYPLHGLVFRDQFAKIPPVPRMLRLFFLIVFYVGLDLFLWIWQLYLIAIAMVANRQRIIGDEWGMGFGQVTALVGVSALCYAIFLSYQDYRLKRKNDTEMAVMAM